MHNVKVNRNLIEPPLFHENDLVYINGEIAYERITTETISTPQIFAKTIYRLQNNSDPADLEQLHKGRIAKETVAMFSRHTIFFLFSDCVNEVKLLGQIGSDIVDENATIFSFVTNSSVK